MSGRHVMFNETLRPINVGNGQIQYECRNKFGGSQLCAVFPTLHS